MLEPWWNPAVEMQAVMRAHRIGQTRPVIATRFCTADTIEERMFDLQKKKALVFEGCMDGNRRRSRSSRRKTFSFCSNGDAPPSRASRARLRVAKASSAQLGRKSAGSCGSRGEGGGRAVPSRDRDGERFRPLDA